MLCLPGLLLPEPQSLWQATADLSLPRRHSNTQRQVCLCLLWRSLLLFLGLGAHRVLFAPSEHSLAQSLGEDSCESLGKKGDQTSPILNETNCEYSLEGLMLKLKLQYFCHLVRRADSLEKTLMMGKIESRRKRG